MMTGRKDYFLLRTNKMGNLCKFISTFRASVSPLEVQMRRQVSYLGSG